MIDYEAAKIQILAEIAESMQTTPEQIDTTQSFADIGLDSLDAVHMLATIESILGTELPEDYIQRVTCLNDIFEMMRLKTGQVNDCAY